MGYAESVDGLLKEHFRAHGFDIYKPYKAILITAQQFCNRACRVEEVVQECVLRVLTHPYLAEKCGTISASNSRTYYPPGGGHPSGTVGDKQAQAYYHTAVHNTICIIVARYDDYVKGKKKPRRVMAWMPDSDAPEPVVDGENHMLNRFMVYRGLQSQWGGTAGRLMLGHSCQSVGDELGYRKETINYRRNKIRGWMVTDDKPPVPVTPGKDPPKRATPTPELVAYVEGWVTKNCKKKAPITMRNYVRSILAAMLLAGVRDYPFDSKPTITSMGTYDGAKKVVRLFCFDHDFPCTLKLNYK